MVVGPVDGTAALSPWIAIAENVHAGQDTVTATVPKSSNVILLMAHEYEGIALSASFITGESATGMNTAKDGAACNPIAVSTAPLLVFGFVTSGVVTVGTNFTQRSTLDANLTEDRVVASAGTYPVTATASGNWTALGAAFKGR
jgi:hypothetical protein